MRRVLVLALLALALPMAAWADGITIISQYGSLTVSRARIISTGSELMQFCAPGCSSASPNRDLGSVSFATGSLATGSIKAGGTFSATGSSFVVKGVGKYGEPKGTIFRGSFVGVPEPGTLGLLGTGLVGIAGMFRRKMTRS